MYLTLVLIALLLAALAAGGAFTHVLEIPGKRRLPLDTAVAVQQQLYIGYRLPGAVIESGAFLATLAALILVWGDGPRFRLILAAFVALAANLLVFLLWTDRENRRIATWRVSSMPTAGGGRGALGGVAPRPRGAVAAVRRAARRGPARQLTAR